MNNLTPLTAIGLSETDLQVYTFLLQNGESGAPKIKDGLDLHPQLVYRSLDHLSEKGLISEYSRGTWKKYKAAPMTEITDVAADLKRSIDRSLEQLAQNIAKEENPDFVRVAIGVEGFIRFRIEMVKKSPEGSVYEIMSGKQNFYESMGDIWPSLQKLHQKKNIKMRMLSFPDLKEVEEKYFGQDEFNEVRFISKYFDSPITVATCGDIALIVNWGKEIISIEITSPIFVADQKKYFELLWQKAKSWDEV